MLILDLLCGSSLNISKQTILQFSFYLLYLIILQSLQEQDSHGGGFDLKQSFVGMMSDVHMWDYVLSSCEIHSYMDDLNFTPGNVLNWRALEYQIVDRVLIEDKLMTCH